MSWISDLGKQRRDKQALHAESNRRAESETLAIAHSVHSMVCRLLSDLATEYWSLTWVDRFFGILSYSNKTWQVSCPGRTSNEGYWRVDLTLNGENHWCFGVEMNDPSGPSHKTIYSKDIDEESLKAVLREAFKSGPAINYD